MFREAHATWTGGPYAGEGAVSTASGILSKTTYAFGSLSGAAPCTTPAELLAAAVASCMATMVAIEMAKAGIRPVAVDTYAVLTLDNPGGRWQITGANLEITARSTDVDTPRFEHAVEAAKRNCPITEAVKINPTCKAKLVSLTSPVPV
jgi:lipoyl-dependent peroxiredoxin